MPTGRRPGTLSNCRDRAESRVPLAASRISATQHQLVQLRATGSPESAAPTAPAPAAGIAHRTRAWCGRRELPRGAGHERSRALQPIFGSSSSQVSVSSPASSGPRPHHRVPHVGTAAAQRKRRRVRVEMRAGLGSHAIGRTDSFSPATRSTATSVDRRGFPVAERER